MKFRVIALTVLLLAMVGTARPAIAGGWAISELISPVPDVVAGEEVLIDVLILQHGNFPVTDATPALTATHRESLTTLTIDGDPLEGVEGGYRFAVTFPDAGEWKWYVTHEPFPGMTSFPTLTVSGDDAAAASTPDAKGDTTITIANSQFEPILLEIAAGTTVTWVNEDMIPHQISSATSIWFDDSPMLQSGESYSFTFEQIGDFQYICGPHTGMSGIIRIS